MTDEQSSSLRWDPYFMIKGNDFAPFWKQHFADGVRNVLFVLGRGFDPRMCNGLEVVLGTGGEGKRDCFLVHFDEGPQSPSNRHEDLLKRNLASLEQLMKKRGRIIDKEVTMWSGVGPGRHRIGSRSAAQIFTAMSDLYPYTDVIVDISAMPRDIYLPLIKKAIYLIDHGTQSGKVPNLHVVVCECAKLDKGIRNVGVDDSASYVHGFSADLDMEATAEIPKVWVPILGERQTVQLEKIYALINPDEICPLLPSPSLDPRRVDELLVEYRELLFDQWRVEPRNIIYAAEQNPFEAYRQIYKVVMHYNQALGPLGGCKSVLSSVSSKLLSIAALLAAYDLTSNRLSIGIAHIEAQGYEIDDRENIHACVNEAELFAMWLIGECYEL